jgi:putative membrane-bound dehydrogenase-like protein
MKRLIACILLLSLVGLSARAGNSAQPLRIFIRAGEKTHGPGQHDGPRFLKEWKVLLAERSAQVDGVIGFPSAEQLANTDVLVMYAQNAGDITPAQREYFDKFLQRGGGIVVVHDAIGSHDPKWLKTVIGGAWDYSVSKFFEGDLYFYYLDRTNPITGDASNFEFDDEMYYDMDLLPEAHILAGTYRPDDRNKHNGRNYPSIYDVAPQMWTYEKDNHRAFVCIPGHNYATFNLPHFRAVLLRGIAWAGKREADLLVNKEELDSLRYPEGGPTAPEDAAKKITVAPGFNINLVASEPLIVKPISMDWDPKGRLWIAETPEYPFRSDRSRAPYDRISILEDTKGLGRMDKRTTFYEGLDLVTSMVFYRDGVIVSQAPYIYWLRDTMGKGVADTKVMLYRGFGTNDTHAVVSNLRWGMDGWIYATVGYSRGDIYSGDGTKHFGRVTEGVIRFKPDGSAMEQVSSKGGNTWGVDFTPDGEIFYSQANGNHIDHVVMREPDLARGRVANTTSYLNIEDHNHSFPLMSWKQQAYVQIDWVGNFTAAAGACIYDGGAWPEKYNGTYYVSDPTINIVHQDFLTPKGVSFVASKDPERLDKEFVASTDLWFRPMHQRVGPDGALYVLDFYNQAVVHNDTRGTRHDPKSNAALRPDRDHYFGRIWRIQHQDAKKLDIPKLDSMKPAVLIKALDHPNEWVRMTALRLLLERNKTDIVPQLEKLVRSDTATTYGRIHGLWLLHDLHQLSQKSGRSLLIEAINSPDAAVAKNALEIANLPADASPESAKELRTAVLSRINDSNQRLRLEAITALGRMGIDESEIAPLIAAYPSLNDRWLQSAFLGAAVSNPQQFIISALDSGKPDAFVNLVAQLAAQIGEKRNAGDAAQLVVLIADKPSSADGLKQVALESLAHDLEPGAVPAWSPALNQAFRSLLSSSSTGVATAALPLAANWDKTGALADEVKTLVQKWSVTLTDASQSDDQRAQIAMSLLAVRNLNPGIVPAVAGILGSGSSVSLQRRIIATLGNVPDPRVGDLLTGACPRLPPELQDAALNELFKRPDWSMALLDAIQSGKIALGTLSPVSINRLRTHSDKSVADRANKLIDELRGPEEKKKEALIARFTPIVVQPGDPVRGHQFFIKNCEVCHRFNGEGKDVAPDLTGMGAHGPAELIVHVLDPNRQVEPNYYAYSIETRDGETYDGIIARENSSSITLRNAAGDIDIKTSDIKSRRNTGLSLMPNGFEALGGETLRDILSFLCAGESNYRIIDLKSAFTANSSKGIWQSEQNLEDTLTFKKFGVTKVGDVPFDVVNPLKSASGNNIIVLKGGSGLSKTYPQKVEVTNIGIKAAKLNFLGGVAGWGYPWPGNDTYLNLPVAKVTVRYAGGGQSEEITLKNGQEFADWNGFSNVPGSKSAADLITHGQVRWFTKPLKYPDDVIQSITLESFDNAVAPGFVAITAETGSTAVAAADPPGAAFEWKPGDTHVLIVGGGSSHDFTQWFDHADSATLAAVGKVSVNYTDKIDDVLPALKDIDVLYLCNNQPMTDPKLRRAIFDFADSGHGLMLLHPAVWYNWSDWPEYNATLVGGGARSHEKYAEFEVTVTEPNHPLMAGVPASFKITDEFYRFANDLKGTPIEVLAEGKSLSTGKTYPVVWIVKHPKARIVCCTLGHDAQAHELAAYKTILQNSLRWAAGK